MSTFAAVERPPVVLREATREDRGYILTSWAATYLDSPAFYDLFAKGSKEWDRLHAAVFARAERLVDAGQVVVAAFDEMPAYILGWVAFGRSAGPVHYVFVRPDERGKGIARMLLGAAGYAVGRPVKATHWTGHCDGKRVIYVPQHLHPRRA